jgi:hypothetical protein
MVRAGEIDRRGDQQLCDAWTNAMSGLKGVPVDSMPELDPNVDIRGTVSFQIESETAE